MLDAIAQKRIDMNINMSIPFYLMAAYAYYVKDNPLFSDAFFDNLAKNVLENWDTIDHYHKSLIKKDDLIAGTYLGKYPSVVEGAVETFRKEGEK